MSTGTEALDTKHPDGDQSPGAAHHEQAVEHGLKDRGYVMVAIVLAVLTAIEVSTYYVDFGPLFLPVLLVLMVAKFLLVVLYFMHLRFDNRIFSYLFYSGLTIALAVYVGALATFKFFL